MGSVNQLLATPQKSSIFKRKQPWTRLIIRERQSTVVQKLVIASAGEKQRSLSSNVNSVVWPDWMQKVKLVTNGVVAFEYKKFEGYSPENEKKLQDLLDKIPVTTLAKFPLLILCDDSEFVSAADIIERARLRS